MTEARINHNLSISLFTIPIICTLLTLVVALTFFSKYYMVVGLPLELPSVETSELLHSDPPIVISISKNGSLSIDTIDLEKDIIPKKLLIELQNREWYLRADEKVEYGKVINVIQQLTKENIEVKLVTSITDEKNNILPPLPTEK